MKYAPNHTASHSDTFEVGGIEYECYFEIEPVQRGGMIDEPWDTYCYDLVITVNGNLIEPYELHKDNHECIGLYANIEKQINYRVQNK